MADRDKGNLTPPRRRSSSAMIRVLLCVTAVLAAFNVMLDQVTEAQSSLNAFSLINGTALFWLITSVIVMPLVWYAAQYCFLAAEALLRGSRLRVFAHLPDAAARPAGSTRQHVVRLFIFAAIGLVAAFYVPYKVVEANSQGGVLERTATGVITLADTRWHGGGSGALSRRYYCFIEVDMGDHGLMLLEQPHEDCQLYQTNERLEFDRYQGALGIWFYRLKKPE